jgi:hypothetical protein
MSRALKWQLPFVSLAGNDCVVKIYAEGFTGTATTLVGGAEPFVIEEDDSKNLLDLVRTTSGYMSVVEDEYGDLDDLFPQNDFQHMVVLEVNGSVQFTGYMQATEYDNDWDRGPRELHFPVMSPLGLMDHYDFPLSLGTPATIYSLRYLLHHVLTTMDCGYEYVYLPGSSLNIDKNVSSLSVVPFNNNFSISGQRENTHKAESFMYLIDGICGAFGWMAHDVPGALVFVKFDYSGEYYRIAVADLIAQDWTYEQTGIYGDDVLTFGDYFTISGNSHRQSLLRPLKEISLSIDGDTAQNAQVSFDRMIYEGMSKTPNYGTTSESDEDAIAAWLSPLDDDIGGTYLNTTNAMSQVGILQNTGVNVSDCGGPNSREKKILIIWDSLWDTNYTSPIFFVNLYEPPSGAIEIKFHLQWSWSRKVGKLGNESYPSYPRLAVKLYCDGHPWSPLLLRTRLPLVFNSSGYFSLFMPTQTPFPVCHKLTIEFYACNETEDGFAGNTEQDMLLALNQISANSLEGVFSSYTENRTRIERLEGSSGSPDAGTLNMPLSFYRENAHLVGLETKLPPQVASFNYMFVSKKTLTLKAKAIAAVGALVYGQVVELEGVQYRLISTSYEPREDDWRLLLVEVRSLPPHPTG